MGKITSSRAGTKKLTELECLCNLECSVSFLEHPSLLKEVAEYADFIRKNFSIAQVCRHSLLAVEQWLYLRNKKETT